jgi:hypothetical protein
MDRSGRNGRQYSAEDRAAAIRMVKTFQVGWGELDHKEKMKSFSSRRKRMMSPGTQSGYEAYLQRIAEPLIIMGHETRFRHQEK